LTVAIIATACSTPVLNKFDYYRVTLDGQPVLGISANDVLIRAVVVFLHGAGGNEFSITDSAHIGMTTALVDAGFAVVASNASGDAFGNAASQHNYFVLGQAAADHYHTEDLYLLAESMGAIAATNLIAAKSARRVRGLAAINPILDLSVVGPELEPIVAQSYADGAIDETNPMSKPIDTFQDDKMRFYVDRNDPKVSAAANAFAFKDRFGASVDISIVECSNGAGDRSCYQGSDLVKWFAEMEKRS
jgi:alpha-beta hydrolase superfamily lysophospholipase